MLNDGAIDLGVDLLFTFSSRDSRALSTAACDNLYFANTIAETVINVRKGKYNGAM